MTGLVPEAEAPPSAAPDFDYQGREAKRQKGGPVDEAAEDESAVDFLVSE